MKFIEDESAYRSNRMNQLFSQLQSVVIPSVIDDIRYVHKVSYDVSWANRARYWFNQFKQIKWERGVHVEYSTKSQQSHSKYHGQRPYRSHKVKEEIAVSSSVNIKSEVVIMSKESPSDSKSINIEKIANMKSDGSKAHPNKPDSNVLSDKSIQTVSSTVVEPIESNNSNNNLILARNVEVQPQATACESEEKDDQPAVKDNEENEGDESKSFIIVEPNISVVTVTDEDNHESSDVDPPEGVNNN